MPDISHKDFACLLNMLESIRKIQTYSGKFKSADDFFNDNISFDATMMNFIVIGEMVDKLSDSFLDVTSVNIDWHKTKGFRNIIAHNYFGIDAEEVWQIIHSSLPKLKSGIELLMK
jgi:uncharacterized protein with HEPN domain